MANLWIDSIIVMLIIVFFVLEIQLLDYII